MYVKRDSRGQVELVSREATPDCREYLPADSAELLGFMAEGKRGQGAVRFQAADLAFVRVLEDVLELLMDKELISFADLPEAARDKVMQRQTLRRRVNDWCLAPGQGQEDGVV